MKLKCFMVDDQGEIRTIAARTLDRVWWGEMPATAATLGADPGPELRAISVVCEDDWEPKVTYFLRLELANGYVPRMARTYAMAAAAAANCLHFDEPLVQAQLECWPGDWRTQLAVALDVPAEGFSNIGVGSPRVIAEALGLRLADLMTGYVEMS